MSKRFDRVFAESRQEANFSRRLERLLVELDRWQAELRLDVARAEQRGLPHLACDLHRLIARVDGVLELGREVAGKPDRGSLA